MAARPNGVTVGDFTVLIGYTDSGWFRQLVDALVFRTQVSDSTVEVRERGVVVAARRVGSWRKARRARDEFVRLAQERLDGPNPVLGAVDCEVLLDHVVDSLRWR